MKEARDVEHIRQFLCKEVLQMGDGGTTAHLFCAMRKCADRLDGTKEDPDQPKYLRVYCKRMIDFLLIEVQTCIGNQKQHERAGACASNREKGLENPDGTA